MKIKTGKVWCDFPENIVIIIRIYISKEPEVLKLFQFSIFKKVTKLVPLNRFLKVIR